ncbi:MAG: G1 family glutamic endopeptidase [Solirubrobacteraceae bacterium]
MTRRIRATLSGVAIAIAVAAVGGYGASSAAAASAMFAHGVSANWSGYATTRTTISRKFERVAGAWTQPAGQCGAGSTTYSAIWVGLGGFERGSQALEQTGSEVDCTPSGEAVYSAWYELVPAGPVPLRLTIHPGDRLSASVAVHGEQVVLQVKNLTSRQTRTVVRRMTSPRPNLTSAEWIVEAPSACSSTYICRTLPLTNFGSVSFTDASATTAQGAHTRIAGSGYEVTALELRDSAPGRQGGRGHEAAVLAGANTSELLPDYSAFTVTWLQLSAGQAKEELAEALEGEGPYPPPGQPYGELFRGPRDAGPAATRGSTASRAYAPAEERRRQARLRP